MRGHIARKGGKYYVVVDLGRDHRNKRKQKWFSGYTRKTDAEKALPGILAKLENGYKEPSDMTVAEYMREWLERKRKNVAYGTYAHYRSYTNNYIIPAIGGWKVAKLSHDILDSFIEEIKEMDDIASWTRNHIYRTLANAMESGKKYGVPSDIMEGIEPPRVKNDEVEYWSQEEMQDFINHLNSKNHSIPIMLALATGMRKGEVLGLRWSKVDFDNKTISVTHQLRIEEKEGGKEWVISPELKTKASYRTIKIDDDTVELLRHHKKQQEKDKLKCGSDYENNDLVCCTSTGSIMKPTYLRTVVNRTIEKSGVKKIHFHGLRHTHATLLLSNGVHPKIVQERLGHRSIRTTLDTYSHIVPGIQEVAASSIQKSLYPKEENNENVFDFKREK